MEKITRRCGTEPSGETEGTSKPIDKMSCPPLSCSELLRSSCKLVYGIKMPMVVYEFFQVKLMSGFYAMMIRMTNISLFIILTPFDPMKSKIVKKS